MPASAQPDAARHRHGKQRDLDRVEPRRVDDALVEHMAAQSVALLKRGPVA